MSTFFNKYGTGILLAATGVGAGDLITSGLAGIHFGTTLIWACIFGATLKYFLNEGLTRYQMAMDETLLTGWVTRISKNIKWPFLIYLVLWSYFVSSALINACGAAATNIFQLTDNYNHSKIIYGVAHSLAGVFIVRKFSYSFIEKLMSFFIFFMFCSVIVTAFLIFDVTNLSISKILIPKITKSNLSYVVAVLGGVGGTLTIMSYSYWLIEKNAKAKEGLRNSRKDLALSYGLTALFSISMIVIGSAIGDFSGPKSAFPIYISQIFSNHWGEIGRYIFLFGFWNGVFSSLLGVWQSVPYLFSDFNQQYKKTKSVNLNTTSSYKKYLYFLALFPITSLWFQFEKVQLAYAIIGALFMPLLALSLIILTNKKEMKELKSGYFYNLIYVITFLCFIYFGYLKIINL